MKMRVAALTALMLMGAAAQAADLTGVPRIVDGDTLAIGATKVRLEGIDAPETDHTASMQLAFAGHAASRPATNLSPTSQAGILPAPQAVLTPTNERLLHAG